MYKMLDDYPCLYILNQKADRKTQVSFFGMLAAMQGLSPSEAVWASEDIARISGCLYGGTGISLDELLRYSEKSFEKPYRSCKCFRQRKVFRDLNIKRCCTICPISSDYANKNIGNERILLHALIRHREWIPVLNCSRSIFVSRLPVSGTNDTTQHNAFLWFNKLLYDYLLGRQPETVTEASVTSYIVGFLKKKGYSLETRLIDDLVRNELPNVLSAPFPNELSHIQLLYGRLYMQVKTNTKPKFTTDKTTGGSARKKKRRHKPAKKHPAASKRKPQSQDMKKSKAQNAITEPDPLAEYNDMRIFLGMEPL